MSNSYFFHCARCALAGITPMPYARFVSLINKLGV